MSATAGGLSGIVQIGLALHNQVAAMTANAPAQPPRTLVVVGSGQGGEAALRRIVAALPLNFNAPIVVSWTSGQRPSVELANSRKQSHLTEVVARDLQAIRSGCIYLATPPSQLVVRKLGQLGLVQPQNLLNSGKPVDALFESAARIYGRNVIGVILSGDSDDGTNGMRAVHAAGGVGLVQSTSDAEKAGMPMNALLGDHPDFVAMLDRMPAILAHLTGAELPKS